MDQTVKPSWINSIYEKSAKTIAGWSTKRFLLTIIIIHILLHLPIIPLPPMGQHTWRQVVWTSMARNYFEEGNSFFYPTQDTRVSNEDKGQIYFEFPLLPYITGMSYHLTGFSHANMRVVMLLMGFVLIYGSYLLMKNMGAGETRARWFTFFISVSPYFFYYSISACPNMPALTWFILGTALIIPRLEEQRWNWKYWLGVVFITIGTLSKVTYLFFGLSVAYLYLNQIIKNPNRKLVAVTLLSGVVVLATNLIVYLHSMELYDKATQHNLVLTPTWFRPESWAEFTETLRPAVIQWFLELFVNTMAIPFFLIGAYWAIKNKQWKETYSIFWALWLVSFGIYTFFFFTQFRDHAYYMTPLLVIAALGSTNGMQISLKSGKLRGLIMVLLICMPLVMVGRVGHRWLWAKQVPDELLYQSEKLQQVIPADQRVIVFGDITPIVYLYYLHRKGITANSGVSVEKIRQYYDGGLRYVVSQTPIDKIPALRAFSKETIAEVDCFTIIRLKE